MIRVAHIGDDGRTVISVSIHAEDWTETVDAVASATANIGDVFDGTFFAPPPAPPMTQEQWMAFVHEQIEAVYAGKRASLASYYTRLDRLERRESLSDDQQADLALLDAAQQWEQAVLDAGARAATPKLDPSSVKWPAPPAGMAELVALS
ncbi:hypothetical protein LB531_21285 [Mesorhizobium sp. CO1-1-2]|uniref:hypothetical protein n=1 Tax=Mesorhizobium sp. CO1-1-2 TaxID=2876635 RepID=UPI001CCD94A1|nr:hypothetical protein [Mesorhizobium sp. CO1-1-2]MBZ9683194.1 hypothetical protein [Mesorhizobium sp. CO1-1-2]